MVQALEDIQLRDLTTGIASSELGEGEKIEGLVGGDRVLLVRSGGAVHAIGAQCTHYGAPLANGLVVGDTIRCPLHHACFNLKNGAALCGPALDPVATFEMAEAEGAIRVGAKRAGETRLPAVGHDKRAIQTIVILGTGAAGTAAADMLRRKGYGGRLVMIGAETELPYDRPNLSKDYLAGTAPEEWLPLRPRAFYDDNGIELILGQRVSTLDPEARELRMLSGRSPTYDRLLLATGSEPVRLPLPTQKLKHVHMLRSLADSRAIAATSQSAKRAVVVGSSFIGLEAAAALRMRGVEVDVVASSGRVFDRVFGPRLSTFIQRLHESHGVRFHLDDGVRAIDETHVTLLTGKRIAADLVVVGVGVRPSVAIAQWAHLDVADGVVVDRFLETSRAGIFAAGDIARWPTAVAGETARAEHWTVAMRQGQIAAGNMLGERVPFVAAPFFWSQHYDVTIQYVGHEGKWDEIRSDGDPDARDCAFEFHRDGKLVAVATIGRELASLRAEAAFERGE
jgi:NADPH-dependent 2,4-dienoyl-CoA reductase/sulfur reductase-like enzyme/nitrite reductase/ring-hydroxylating ferredoxin subunit